MDTSTMSHTPAEAELDRAASLTSVAQTESVQPGLEWFTRLITPLTRHSSISEPPAGAASTGIIVQSAMAQIGEEKVDVKLNDQVSDKAITESYPEFALDQQPWTGRGGAPTMIDGNDQHNGKGMNIVLLILIPILAVVLTVLLGLIVFLVAMLYMRRKKGIRLTEDGGPLDLSKGDGVIGEGGVPGVEARWLETVDPDVREAYRRAKEYQSHYPPASVPTDITLSQFLSIQEKGVSAWSFEPDYEDNLSLYVQSRTEITFLSDGPGMPTREGGGNSVMANLPLPKTNEVYYWEVKLYDKPANTEVAIGLATKPYPSFRLPGWNRYSVAYFASDGFKAHNYPFTSSSHGPPLNEGDVLGVGYRPRTGTVFFTRNGRKMDDAYTGLQRFNLFPVIGANGPCTIHVNLGQAGFVFIEANVKKWGLAPMVGTLAPPPAYGSERGSILLDAGYGTPSASAGQSALQGVGALLEAARNRAAAGQQQLGRSFTSMASGIAPSSPSASASGSPSSASRPIPTSPNRSTSPSSPKPHSSRRHRRAGKSTNLSNSIPAVPSPLRGEAGPGPSTAGSRRRALAVQERGLEVGTEDHRRKYISPTDTPLVSARVPPADADEDDSDTVEDLQSGSEDEHGQQSRTLEPESPMEHNPPTPNLLDISLHSLRRPSIGQYFSQRAQEQAEANTNAQRGDGDDEHSGSEEEEYDSEEDEHHHHDDGPDVDVDTNRLSPGGAPSANGSASGSDDTIRPTDRARPAVPVRFVRNSHLGPPADSPPPPGYAPLDPHMYARLPADLPEELVNQAIAAMSDDNPSSAVAPSSNAQPTEQESSRASGPLGWIRRGLAG